MVTERHPSGQRHRAWQRHCCATCGKVVWQKLQNSPEGTQFPAVQDAALPLPHVGAASPSQQQQGQVTWPQWKWLSCPGPLSKPGVRTLRPRASRGFCSFVFLCKAFTRKTTRYQVGKRGSPLPRGQPGPGHKRQTCTNTLLTLQSPGRNS